MAQLNQFLGTVLSELTQARVTSDIFSRDTSNFYQQDPVLRSYSVPRVNIDEFEMEMQFAIAGLVREQNNTDQSIKLERLFSTSAQKFADKLSQATIAFFSGESTTEQDVPAIRLMLMRLRHAGERSKIGLVLSQRLNQSEFFDSEHYFLPDPAVPVCVDSFLQQATSQLELPANLKDEMTALRNNLLEEAEALAAELENAVRFMLENAENHNLDVEVCADRLRERPQNTLCTLKLKGCFKNYVWTNSTQQDGSSVQKLVQE